jgi:hypothetical protein
MLLEQQNKNRKYMVRQGQGSASGSPAMTAFTQTAVASSSSQPLIDEALLTQYQREMSSAAQMPLPDEDDLDDDLEADRDFECAKKAASDPQYENIQNEAIDPNLGFGEEGALESFDFDSFLHQGDNKDAFASNDFSFGASPDSTRRTVEWTMPSTGASFGLPSFSPAPSGNLFGSPSSVSSAPSTSPFGGPSSVSSAPSASLFGHLNFSSAPSAALSGNSSENVPTFSAQLTPSRAPIEWKLPESVSPSKPVAKPRTDDELLDGMIALQTFEGSWEWRSDLFNMMSVNQAAAAREASNLNFDGLRVKEFATALAIAFLEERLGKLKGTWELVVEKARGWLGPSGEDAIGRAKVFLGKK